MWILCTYKFSENNMWLQQHNTVLQHKSLSSAQQKERVYLTHDFPQQHFHELMSFIQQKPVELQRLQYGSDTFHQLQIELHTASWPHKNSS